MATLDYWSKNRLDPQRTQKRASGWKRWCLQKLATLAVALGMIPLFIIWSLWGHGNWMPLPWIVVDAAGKLDEDWPLLFLACVGGMLMLVGWMPASIAISKMEKLPRCWGRWAWRLWVSLALWCVWLPHRPWFHGWNSLVGC